MKKAIVIAIFIFSGCGGMNQIDSEFIAFTSEFENLLTQNRVRDRMENLIMRFASDAELTDEQSGRCIRKHGFGRNLILMNKNIWSTKSEFSRKMVIFHELGHCVLGRKHNEEMIKEDNWDIPVSIMYPITDGLRPDKVSGYESELIKFSEKF